MLFWDIGQNFGRRLAALVLQQDGDSPNTSIPYTKCHRYYGIHSYKVVSVTSLKYVTCFRYSIHHQILHYNRDSPKYYQCKVLIFTFESIKIFILKFDRNLNLFPINAIWLRLKFWCDTMNS